MRRRDRIFALIIAGAFFATTFAFSFFVIWQIVNDNKEANKVDESSQSINATDPNSQSSEGKLAGTKLAGFTPQEEVRELQKIDTKVGDGQEAKPGDTVTVDYTGAVVATGVIFQSSVDFGEPVSFSLDQVIKGWKDGIPGMKVGGERRLIIPADEAYGANPPPGSGIPANAPLVFDVKLHAIGE